MGPSLRGGDRGLKPGQRLGPRSPSSLPRALTPRSSRPAAPESPPPHPGAGGSEEPAAPPRWRRRAAPPPRLAHSRPRGDPRHPHPGRRDRGSRPGAPGGRCRPPLQLELGPRAQRRGSGRGAAWAGGWSPGLEAPDPQTPLGSPEKGTSRDAGERRVLPQRSRWSPQPLERASECCAAALECEPLLTVPRRPRTRSPERPAPLVAAQPPPPPPPPPPPSAPAPSAGPPAWLAPSFALLKMTMIFF